MLIIFIILDNIFQSWKGLIVLPARSDLQVSGPRNQRFVQLTGSPKEIIDVLHNSRYYPLPDYFGPDTISLSLHSTNVSICDSYLYISLSPFLSVSLYLPLSLPLSVSVSVCASFIN